MRLPFWESESLVENFAHMKQKHKYKINNLRLDALKIVKGTVTLYPCHPSPDSTAQCQQRLLVPHFLLWEKVRV